MKKTMFLVAIVLTAYCLQAQTDSLKNARRKNFQATLATMDKKTIKGTLFNVSDNEIIMRYNVRVANSKNLVKEDQMISAENINTISFRRKNSGLRGALIGLGVGALTGVIIGFASGDDPIEEYPQYDPLGLNTIAISISNSFAMTAGEKAVAGGIALGAGGALVGAIIGAVAHKKFTIGGKKEKFHDLQAKLMQRIVVK